MTERKAYNVADVVTLSLSRLEYNYTQCESLTVRMSFYSSPFFYSTYYTCCTDTIKTKM